MRWCLSPGHDELFSPARGCDHFVQRIVRLDGASSFGSTDEDELLYVLAGRGRLTLGGDVHLLSSGAAAYAAPGTSWTVDDADGLELLSVRVRDPLPGATHAFVAGGAAEQGTATAGRAFLMLCSPAVGCNSATQFVGLIPKGRAPEHFHRYDEVIYVLDGEGMLEIDGERAPIRAGSSIHLPRTLVHCLANTGDTEMRVLGVFRPAGSPAEAYYPDGTPAAVPEE
jgi:quercetin dioxygenase-like cupin family protein